MSEKDLKKPVATSPEAANAAQKPAPVKKPRKGSWKKEPDQIINYDQEGNVIPESFPVSKSTKRDYRKTSVMYTLFAVILHILAVIPPVAATLALAVKTYNLLPAYTFWHFIGTAIVALLMIVFIVITLIVYRKKSKSSIFAQTAKAAFTFVCLTTVFGMIVSYIVPDIIAKATSKTLFAEDLYYNGEQQAEVNAKLERDFIRYNILNGNLNNYTQGEDGSVTVAENGDFSYKTLSKRESNADVTHSLVRYLNDEVEESYRMYEKNYPDINSIETNVLDYMRDNEPYKYEMYEFIYESYVLNDFDYALYNNVQRRAFALALLDYVYTHSDYETYLSEGMGNARLKNLFDKQFDNFNQDGYNTFDDSLLLYAQAPGRMTVPVVLRLILNKGWSYSQPALSEDGSVQYADDGNFLYQMYAPEVKAEFDAADGEYNYTGKLVLDDGEEVEVKYGFNSKGWMVFENGVIKRPLNWLVLDMQGTPMDITKIALDQNDIIVSAVLNVFPSLGSLFSAAGGLLQDDLANLIQYATNDAMLSLSIYMTDNDEIAISVVPMNAVYGMLGYMQASYVQSNNLLMTVINLFGIRNWLFIFAGVGAVLIIAGGVLRECGKRTRERTEIARDRIIRANTTPEGKLPEDEKKAAKKAAKDAKKGKHDEAPTADKGAAPVGRPAPRPGAPRPARRPQK